jgi:hypothetical protein
METKVCPCCGSEVVTFQSRSVLGGLDVTGRCQLCGCAWDSAYATSDVADDLRCEFSLGEEFGLRLD